MDKGHFYFIDDQYFIDFPDPYLMKNKGPQHDRPCFYAFKDERTGLYWMIPFTSKLQKFQAIYAQKVNRYGRCDTIEFGDVLGHPKAFLIQNMCPITPHYIKSEYIDAVANIPVRINGALEARLIQKAQRALVLQRKGKRLIFPDVLLIERTLLQGEVCLVKSEE